MQDLQADRHTDRQTLQRRKALAHFEGDITSKTVFFYLNQDLFILND